MYDLNDPSKLEYIGTLSFNALTLSMLGNSICAGFPSPADDYIDEKIDLVRVLMPNKTATFLWRVNGHSMVETGIHDGDVVVVDRSQKPRHGGVIVASINGEMSLKVFTKTMRDGRPSFSLSFANRKMPVFELCEQSSIEICGVVTWTLHKPSLK